MAGEPLLELAGVARRFDGPTGPVQALAETSLVLARGELAIVEGPSGSGKTTLLLIAGGLLRPSAGGVTLDGRRWGASESLPDPEWRAGRVGFVFQQFYLIPYLTVRENLLSPTLALGLADAVPRAEALADRFGLSHRLDHRPARLSAGEQQRAALARAMLQRPPLLLADEPTGNLDRKNGETVLKALAEYAAEGGSVLAVTHDPAAAAHAGRTYRLENGVLNERSRP